jgi:hypothetical protein
MAIDYMALGLNRAEVGEVWIARNVWNGSTGSLQGWSGLLWSDNPEQYMLFPNEAICEEYLRDHPDVAAEARIYFPPSRDILCAASAAVGTGLLQ